VSVDEEGSSNSTVPMLVKSVETWTGIIRVSLSSVRHMDSSE